MGRIKNRVIGLLTAVCLILGGCTPTEVEDREFPVILTVKKDAEFPKAWMNSLQEGRKKIDYNHLKVVVLERGFLEEEAKMSEMLSLLKQDKNVPLNAYVVAVDDLERLIKAGESLDIPLGNYIEELLEHADGIKKETYPTLGMLYQEKENRMETLFIPYLSLVDEKPEVTAYEVYQRGKAVGVAETDAALLSFFISNQMEEYVLQLGVNNFVRLSNADNQITFKEHRKESGLIQKQVQVEICCDAESIFETVSGDKVEAQEWLTAQIVEYMTVKTADMLENGVDLTNSKKKLGGSMREWYERYLSAAEFYEEEIEIVFTANFRWIE